MPRPVMSKTFSSVMSTFSRHCEPSTRFLRIRPTVTLRAVRSRSRDTCSRRGDIHGTGGGAAEGVPVVPGNARTSQPRPGGRSVEVVDSRTEIRDFLTSRRAKITPDQAGLPVYGGNRRVAGLRREEVAMLAGVSVDCGRGLAAQRVQRRARLAVPGCAEPSRKLDGHSTRPARRPPGGLTVNRAGRTASRT